MITRPTSIAYDFCEQKFFFRLNTPHSNVANINVEKTNVVNLMEFVNEVVLLLLLCHS